MKRIISVYGFICWALGVTRKRRTLERLQRYARRERKG